MEKKEFATDGEINSRTLYQYTTPPLPSLGGSGGVSEGSKIISNKTNSMNIQSNLNIKYNIHVHCTDSMHLISIRKVADRKFQKKGEITLKMSVLSRDITLNFAYFNLLSKDLYNDIYDLGVLYNFENPTESLC